MLEMILSYEFSSNSNIMKGGTYMNGSTGIVPTMPINGNNGFFGSGVYVPENTTPK